MLAEAPVFSTTKACHSDLSLINKIYYLSKGYWGYSKEFLDQYLSVYQLDETYLDHNPVYLLSMNNTILGYYGFEFEEDGTLDLDHFFLLPEYIGKGYGRILWNYACETARSLNKKEFSLWSEPSAEPFYLKMGCEIVGMKASEFLDEKPSALMKFKL